jgi:hypothetical protein
VKLRENRAQSYHYPPDFEKVEKRAEEVEEIEIL